MTGPESGFVPPEIGPRQFVGYFFEPDDLLGWRMVPGRCARFVKPPIHTLVRINNLGMRGPDLEVEKPAGVRRVLLLADSFGVAIEVAEEDTFPRVLERQLNQGAASAEARFQVVNASVGGYGTEQAYLYLQSQAARFQPDLVVLGFHYGDDVLENNPRLRELVHWRLVKLPRPILRTREDGSLVLEGYPPDPRALQQAWQRYYDLLPLNLLLAIDPHLKPSWRLRLGRRRRRVLEAARNNMQRWRQRKTIPYDLRVFANPPDPLFEQAWALTGRILEAMQAQAYAWGASFLVVGLPTKEQTLPGYLERRLAAYPATGMQCDPTFPNTRLAGILSRCGIPYLDLTPTFRQAITSGEALFFDHDLHWNEAGHRLAGREIARFVTRTWTRP